MRKFVPIEDGETECECGEDMIPAFVIDDDGDVHGECMACGEYVEMQEVT